MTELSSTELKLLLNLLDVSLCIFCDSYSELIAQDGEHDTLALEKSYQEAFKRTHHFRIACYLCLLLFRGSLTPPQVSFPSHSHLDRFGEVKLDKCGREYRLTVCYSEDYFTVIWRVIIPFMFSSLSRWRKEYLLISRSLLWPTF